MITVMAGSSCKGYMSPAAGGAQAFAYNMLVQYGRDLGQPYWSAAEVSQALQRLQATFPLGFADLTIVLVPLRLVEYFDPATGEQFGQIDGRLDLARGLLLLGEINPDRGLAALLAHELGHAVWRRWIRQNDTDETPALRRFLQIANIATGEWPEDGPWHRRLRELGAELIAQSLWRIPPRADPYGNWVFPPLSLAQAAEMRQWITGLWGTPRVAEIRIVERLPQVHMYPDGTTLVDGLAVPWADDMRPRLVEVPGGGRFFMSLRAIMEQVVNRLVEPYGLRAGIDWDDAAGRAVPWIRQR